MSKAGELLNNFDESDFQQGLTNFIKFKVEPYEVFVSTRQPYFTVHYDYPNGSMGHKSFREGQDGKWLSFGMPEHDQFMQNMSSATWKIITMKAIDILDNPHGYSLMQRKQELGFE